MKANRWTRLLAAIDEACAAILNLHTWICTPGPHEASRVKSFWLGWGTRFAIINKEGQIRAVGHSWQVEHLFDSEGYLIGRKRYVKLLRPGEQVIYGQTLVDATCRAQTGVGLA